MVNSYEGRKRNMNVRGITVESGDFFHDITREPMIDEFILFILDKPFLESQQAPVLLKPEHIDECIEIKSGIAIRSFCYFQTRFFKLKIFS